MKILLLDIENSPSETLMYDLIRPRYVPPGNVQKPGEIMCFAAKWLGRPKVSFYSAHHHGREEMVGRAHELLDEADVVMHYYGKRHDIPKLNTAMLLTGLKPPSPYKQIDLYSVVRAQFAFEYRRLDYVSKALGLKGKVKHPGMPMYIACMAGDEKAWRKMRQYNIQDVRLLEELYGFMQPWIPRHPSHGTHEGADVCPYCGDSGLEKRGFYHTAASRFQRYRCKKCGGWSHDTKRVGATTIREAA